MPQDNGVSRDGQPTWPVYVTAMLIVGLVLLVANIPLAVVITGIVISDPGAFASAIWLVIIGIPTLALDIWLVRWLRDNLQVLHWTNQSLHKPRKGDRTC